MARKNNDGGCLLWLGILILAAASILYFYWIATSNLPDWLKFYLLK